MISGILDSTRMPITLQCVVCRPLAEVNVANGDTSQETAFRASSFDQLKYRVRDTKYEDDLSAVLNNLETFMQ